MESHSQHLTSSIINLKENGDIKTAKECVGKCKSCRTDDAWKYSEAFLAAYQGFAPSTVIAKYQQAFKVEYSNLINIADYVEYILEKEPLRKELHLAAGLIYEGIGDVRLMKRHFFLFIDSLSPENSRVLSVLKEKIKTSPCELECGNNCQACSEQQVG